MKILLASQSPRRKELLKELGFEFETVSVECDEIYPSEMPVAEVAQYLSKLKSKAYRDLKKDEILITADTIVAVDNEILGKPRDYEDAFSMLKKLSGRRHHLYTGITLRSSEKLISKTDVANVSFDIISDYECEYYLKKHHPFDKAGSYGIQEWLGMAKINRIEGSFYTIMGLPTHLVYTLMQEFQHQKNQFLTE